jgi:dienelactone hydrolase
MNPKSASRNFVRSACAAAFVTAAAAVHVPAQTTQPSALFQYDRGTPSGQIVDTKSGSISRREKILIAYEGKDAIPAILSIPAKGTGPFPVVVAIHGAYVDRKEFMIDRLAARLNKVGVACIAYDLPDHGQRIEADKSGFRHSLGLLMLDFAAAAGRNVPPELRVLLGFGKESATLKHFDTVGRGIASSVTDARRVIDYLETRPELDATRVAAAGVSLGGAITVLLTNVDPRVVAASVNISGAWPLVADRVAGDPAVKALYDQIDPRPHAACISPRPVLMINGRRDSTVTPDNALALYDSLNEPKQIIWYDTGHHLPGAAIDEVTTWLSGMLNNPSVPRAK